MLRGNGISLTVSVRCRFSSRLVKQRNGATLRRTDSNSKNGHVIIDQFLKGRSVVCIVILSVSDKEQNIGCASALVVECLEALEGAIHRCLEIGAAAGHLSCIRDVEQHPDGRVVGGKGNLNKRLIGKDNQADPISLQAVHKPVEFQLCLVQTTRPYILSIHASGEVQGDHQVDPLPLYFPHFRAGFRTSKGDDSKEQGCNKTEKTGPVASGPVLSPQLIDQPLIKVSFNSLLLYPFIEKPPHVEGGDQQ